MEMPVDVITKHTTEARASTRVGLTASQMALNIDLELQSKFLFFPIEELEADGAAIEDDRGILHAGDGPEHCQARPGENPDWLFNHARNALTLYWRLQQDAEKAEAEQLEAAKLARRPEPGIYSLDTGRAEGVGSSTPKPYLVAVTAERRIIDLNKTGGCTDFTDVFDNLRDKSRWTFTLVETGLSA